MSMCRVFSWVVGKGHWIWPACSLGKALLAFALLHFYSVAKLACYSGFVLTCYFCMPIPYDDKDVFFFFGVHSRSSSILGILLARILEWVALPFFRGSSWPRNQSPVSCVQADSLPSEPRGKPIGLHRTGQLQLLQHQWGIDLNYYDVEWFALETNRDYVMVFETASK